MLVEFSGGNEMETKMKKKRVFSVVLIGLVLASAGAIAAWLLIDTSEFTAYVEGIGQKPILFTSPFTNHTIDVYETGGSILATAMLTNDHEDTTLRATIFEEFIPDAVSSDDFCDPTDDCFLVYDFDGTPFIDNESMFVTEADHIITSNLTCVKYSCVGKWVVSVTFEEP